MLDINKLKVGDVLSETSHYVVKKIYSSQVEVLHFESNTAVNIGAEYLKSYISSGNEILEEVKVTKEDKKDGTFGIRSIFENIHSSQVFTVCFKKQDTPKSQKKLKTEIDNLITHFSNEIDHVQKSKKGVAEAAKNFAEELIKNPILPYEEGEERILRGFKVQFESRDGRYNCVDMDIPKTEKELGIRPVNINTIKYLIIGGTKYIVE